jgi:hypothetical protein
MDCTAADAVEILNKFLQRYPREMAAIAGPCTKEINVFLKLVNRLWGDENPGPIAFVYDKDENLVRFEIDNGERLHVVK